VLSPPLFEILCPSVARVRIVARVMVVLAIMIRIGARVLIIRCLKRSLLPFLRPPPPGPRSISIGRLGARRVGQGSSPALSKLLALSIAPRESWGRLVYPVYKNNPIGLTCLGQYLDCTSNHKERAEKPVRISSSLEIADR
jgi:hypothetical protein